jgi:hypothetical protein
VEAAKTQITLASLAVGTRLLVRSRLDWRFAAVSRLTEDRVVLTVCSPTGRTYRLRREMDAQILMDGTVPVLPHESSEDWRENFGRYDHRW